MPNSIEGFPARSPSASFGWSSLQSTSESTFHAWEISQGRYGDQQKFNMIHHGSTKRKMVCLYTSLMSKWRLSMKVFRPNFETRDPCALQQLGFETIQAVPKNSAGTTSYCVRPARPALCFAWTWETSVICRDSIPVFGLKNFCLQ